MSSPHQQLLLRRTLAALVAVSGLGFAGAVQAQGTVTLTGASGNNCSYSAMSITPNGNVNVTCTGAPPPPPPVDAPGTIAFANAHQTVTPGTPKATVQITRTNGNKGAFRVALAPYGAACWGQPDSVDVADGASGASFEMTIGTIADTFCEITMTSISPLGATTGATLGSTKSTRVTVTSGTVTPPPVGLDFSKCPTGYSPPENLITATLPSVAGQLLQQAQKSGQIVTMDLPKLPGWATGQVTFSENAGSPQPVTIEISVNKCPGLIETDYTTACNIKSQFGHNNKVQWLAKPFGGFNESSSPQAMAAYGLCWGGSNNTKYYVNARWTYPSCGFGLTACGFAVQYNQGDY